jgi:hypothetical protein
MHRIVAASAQEFFNHALDAHPDLLTFDVAVGQQLVRPHGRVNRRLEGDIARCRLGSWRILAQTQMAEGSYLKSNVLWNASG